MSNPLLLPDIRLMLEENDEPGIREIAAALHPATVADAIEELPVDQIWTILSYAPVQQQAEIFEYFPLNKQIDLCEETKSREKLTRILEAMASDDRAHLLSRLDKQVVESIMPLMAHAERHDIRLLLSYQEGTAGSILTTDYATLPADITEEEAISRLRRIAPNRETIYYVYIVDDQRHLLGLVTLRQLILARPTAKLSDIMRRDVISVRVDDDQEKVAQILARYNFIAVPVVDDTNRIVGIVTHDDVLDLLVEEHTEDAHRMGAVAPLESGYMDEHFVSLWRKRAAWLSCLFVAELFTFTALANFEDKIKAVVALSLFVPLCISTGGNSGSQAATLITRSLALGEIALLDWWKILRREFLMGIALGATLGVIAYVRASFTPLNILGNVDRWTLAAVICFSVGLICIWGTLVGSMLPLVFKRLGFDPGIASSPFVATFVDVTGIIIYFTIAQAFIDFSALAPALGH